MFFILGLYDLVVNDNDERSRRLKKTALKLLTFFGGVSDVKPSILSNHSTSRERPEQSDDKSSFSKAKSLDSKRNKIPVYYKNKSHIVGKDRTVYKMHSGIAFQTQNFPYLENFKKFPNAILNPGENYRHTITYKFWIRAGNPIKWIKKNKHEMGKLCF